MPKMTRKKLDLPFAIYARLSRAVTGDLEKVEWQIAKCKEYAARRGIKINDKSIYADNNLSAWKQGVVRPGWDSLMADVEAGLIGGVIVWAIDRFTRRPKDLETLIEYSLDRHLVIESVRSGRFDLTTPDGKMQARWMALQATGESDNTSARVRAAFERLVRDGKPIGARVFGFEKNGQDQIPEQVEALRHVADRLLRGETLESLAAWLNDQGFRTARGNQLWEGPGLGRCLALKRYGGLIEFHGEVVARIKRSDGTYEPPVFDQDTYEMVQALLLSRRRGRRPSGLFPYTGVVECSECGVTLCGGHLTRDGVRFRTYTCHRRQGGCGCQVKAATVEEQIDQYMVELIDDEDNLKNIAEAKAQIDDRRAEIARKIDEVEQKLIKLEVKFAEGLIIPAAYSAARTTLMKQRSVATGELDDLQPVNGSVRVGVDWGDLEQQERRQLLRHYRVKIEVLPYGTADPVTGTRVRFGPAGG